jgi:potassium-dependent mechanosensitive channel
MTLLPILRFLRWVALALVLLGAGAEAAEDKGPLDLEATRNALTAIENTLRDSNLNDTDLLRLHAENEPLGVALQAAIADLTPRLAASVKRLAELTPKTKDKDAAPATDAATAELESEKQKHDALDANLRAARAMLLETDDISTRIGARRRELFARETFARTSSVFNPQLWLSVSREIPGDVHAVADAVGDWWSGVRSRVTTAQALGIAGAAFLLALVAAPIYRMARRVIFRDPDAGSRSRLKRALTAAWTMLVLAVLPLLGLWVVAVGLDVFDLSDPRMQGVFDAILDAARLLALVNAVGRGMLAPQAAAWRLIPVSDRTARRLFSGVLRVAAIWAAERLIEPAADAVGSLNIAVAGRAVGAALVALVIAHTLRRLSPGHQAGAAAAQSDRWAPARALGWSAAIAIFAAATLGYVAFAAFLVNQAFYLSILGCILHLTDVIIYDGAEALMSADALVGARLRAMLGLRHNVLAQIVVVAQGVARLALIVIAAAAVLEPWGVQSQDWFVSLRTAYFGFGVGGVTLSLSSMLAAGATFGVALFVTRLIQAWLTDRLLPQTGLDAGVSNSISTIFGYVGATVAVLLGAAQVGLDVQKLAIVAGALSVGIGFGLQSIANNFVSGLILLWERGVRVGDWVMVGADQGFVRRINARATEIETFDRATVIVPNSNLVTGVVKNWVNPDRVGRILIAINVDYDSDVEKVREILIDAARSHDLVLKIPAPSVQFADFGDWAFKFNLVCFVDDVETSGRAQSELNFDILRRLRDANLRIPTPQVTPFRPAAE